MKILARLPLARRPATRLALGLGALLACAAAPARAQTTLAAGEAVILSFNQSLSTFKWAPLVDLAANTVIGITDYGYPGGAANVAFPLTTGTTDGFLTITFTSAVARGTIFTVTVTAPSPSVTMTRDSDGASFTSQVAIGGGAARWSLASLSTMFTTGGDSLIIYQGTLSTSASFIFVAACTNNAVPNSSGGFLTAASNNTGGNASAVPPGLTIGTNAVGWQMATLQDYRAAYTGAVTAADKTAWLARIVGSGNSPSNWTFQSNTSPSASFGTTLNVTLPDTTPPTVTSIIRQTPSGQSTTSASATFRVTFSEAVNAPTTANFAVAAVNSSTITGTIASGTAVSTSVYDVAVTITGGTGEFRLKVID